MNAETSPGDSWAKIKTADAAELACGVVELTRAGLPLPDGLRALAEELPSRRSQNVLNDMADRLERGVPFEEVMQESSRALPTHLHGLLLAGIRSGKLPEVLEQYLQMETSQRILRNRLRLSMIYPIILAVFLALLVELNRHYIAIAFLRIFKDFGTSLPGITVAYFQSIDFLFYFFVALALFLGALPFLITDAPGLRWFSPIVYFLPIVGTLKLNSRRAAFTRLMTILLNNKIPLPDALRWTADGLADPFMARACRGAALDVQRGLPLSEAMAARSWIPRGLIPFIERGEAMNALPDAFDSAATMYEGRMDAQSAPLVAILVPIILFIMMTFVGLTVLAIFMPLIQLITRLTGGK